TLQNMIDAAPAGSVLQVPACTYRESVSINKPLTLDGLGKAQIRGSDVWTAWAASGATWTSSQTVPRLPRHGPCRRRTACQLSGQVCFDHKPLARTPAATPATGQFALDASRHVIIADNPSGHTLEVTTRPGWLQISGKDVTVQGFNMRHAADYGIT